MVTGSGETTLNTQMLEVFKRFKKLFTGKQTRFSARAKRTISVSTLAAAGASDYGVQSVIFGTLKAVCDEIRLSLTPKQLANAVPDVGTLRNWEFDVAAGCMAKVIAQIMQDAEDMMKRYGTKLQITLVTDLCNRAGVDHFVKMIVWTSVDKSGQLKLNHFNLQRRQLMQSKSLSRLFILTALMPSFLSSAAIQEVERKYNYCTLG